MNTLLIIEDDPYVREIYREAFSHQQYEVSMAADGEEGLAQAQKNKPRLILLDLMIPKINGFDVLARLKSDPDTKEIAVLVLTNLGEEKYIKRAVELGAAGFMIKAQFSIPDMVKEVEKHFGKLDQA